MGQAYVVAHGTTPAGHVQRSSPPSGSLLRRRRDGFHRERRRRPPRPPTTTIRSASKPRYRGGDSTGGYDVATGDPTADIADLFAFYTGEKGNPKSVVLILTWRADPVEDKEKSFDPTVKYGIHIDTSDKKLVDVKLDGDGINLGTKLHTTATHDIIVWYGEHKKKKGEWGMVVSGLPGVEGHYRSFFSTSTTNVAIAFMRVVRG
jgi:hypothetical protein